MKKGAPNSMLFVAVRGPILVNKMILN